MTMGRLVIDTNIISYIFKKNSLGPAYDARIRGYLGIISFQTYAELEQWMLRDSWGERRKQALRDYLQDYIVIHSDERLIQSWGWIRQVRQQTGTRIDADDAWIAATALALKAPLVTHNASDFAGIPGLKVITEHPG